MTRRFLPGTPNLIDLFVDDTAAAQNFYGALFGWDFHPGGNEEYTVCRLGTDTVAGMLHSTDIPTAWIPYFASDDVHATAERITQAGGKMVTDPMQILDMGWVCVGEDPTGATFGMWQGLKYPGVHLWGEPGSGAWVELHTTDASAADHFYRQLFGYQQRQVGDGNTVDYSVWSLDDDNDVAGRVLSTDSPPHWTVYFEVTDCDAAMRKIQELGGEITTDATDSEYGRYCMVADPTSAEFGLISPTEIAISPTG